MTEREITTDLFESLLEWIGPTREEGAKQYELIRSRLIKILTKKGCLDPEYLADETITRITLKLPEIRDGYVGDPLWYFIAVARTVWLESLRAREIAYERVPERIIKPDQDLARECLQQCLRLLPKDQCELVLDYHVNQKRAKTELHQEMAAELGLSINALRLRAYRIRAGLEKCLLECLNGQAK